MDTIPAKTLITKTKNTMWFGCEYNMNIYRGCTHGCIYCDSRSECYRNDDFEHVRAKADALRVLRDDLRRKVRSGVVATGSMSDPYNPHEEREHLTRNGLELLSAYGFGVAIATKSPLVTRDIDILTEIAAHSPVIVKITITTADDALCKRIEPNVAVSSERFKAIKTLAEANIFCGILLMPLLPFLNDTEENVLTIVKMAAEHGARFVYPGFGVTLRDSQRAHFYHMLEKSFPDVREKYQARYGDKYSCDVPNAKALHTAFAKECDKYGLLHKMPDIIAGYKTGYAPAQFSFFD